LASLDVTAGCWLWTAPPTGGLRLHCIGTRTIGTHRLALLLDGRIPERGEVACHSCAVRRCVRPDHLRWATPAENTRHMIDRRRAWWQ
jgi:hypothetical protein